MDILKIRIFHHEILCVPNWSCSANLKQKPMGTFQLIKPEEMINPNIDEQSMMTYLSQYPNAKIKTGAPLRPRTNPNRWAPVELILLFFCNQSSFHPGYI